MLWGCLYKTQFGCLVLMLDSRWVPPLVFHMNCVSLSYWHANVPITPCTCSWDHTFSPGASPPDCSPGELSALLSINEPLNLWGTVALLLFHLSWLWAQSGKWYIIPLQSQVWFFHSGTKMFLARLMFWSGFCPSVKWKQSWKWGENQMSQEVHFLGSWPGKHTRYQGSRALEYSSASLWGMESTVGWGSPDLTRWTLRILPVLLALLVRTRQRGLVCRVRAWMAGVRWGF